MQSMCEVEHWESAIQCDGRVVVLETTASTQEGAIEHNLKSGDVCAALHQTLGRGRRGNEWDSSGGVSVTVVLEESSPQLSIAVAAVLAERLDALVTQSVGIKWPNDLYVGGKKLAGILIEQRDGVCLVGIGVNVKQNKVPNAAFLSELGFEKERAFVSNLIVDAVFSARDITLESAITLWQSRDILVGTIQTFISDNKSIMGTVLSIDPLHNLVLQTDTGLITLDAHLTRGQLDV
jgi:BirA family biotin operon repressor/biotin-[acetyl-CoA-carboxylase] ligase